MTNTLRQITISFALCAFCFGGGPQSVARGGTEDYTDPKLTTCPVHKVALTKIRLPITYGLLTGSSLDRPDMKRSERFPYSYERILGGCVVSKDSPQFAWIHHCSVCARMSLEWCAKNPRDPAPMHRRPVAPGNHIDYARILIEEQNKAEMATPRKPSD